MVGRLVGGAWALLFVSTVARAEGASDAHPVRVEVQAPPGCSDDTGFFNAVHARTKHVRLAAAPSESAAHTLRVRLEPMSGTVKGELVVIDEQGGATHRELSGDTCEAVVSGLAWVAARALDPALGANNEADLPPWPAPPPRPPTPPLFPCEVTPPVPHTLEEPEPPPPVIQPRWRVTVGSEAAVFGAAAPAAALDVDGFVDFAHESESVLAPAFRFSAHHTSSVNVDVTATSASFEWTFARAEVCPWRFDLANTVELRACGLFDAGVLFASGGGGVGFQAASQLQPWLAAGALARLEWRLVGPLRLEADGGLAVPFVRKTFAFDPSTSVYEAPAVLGLASLGLGVRFP